MKPVVDAALLPMLGGGTQQLQHQRCQAQPGVPCIGPPPMQPCSKTELVPEPAQADCWPAHEAWQTSLREQCTWCCAA